MHGSKRRFWRITVYERGDDRVVAEIPTNHTTGRKVKELMRMLCAKHWLTDDEVVAAHLRANVSGYHDRLAVTENRLQGHFVSYEISRGSFFVHASIVNPECD